MPGDDRLTREDYEAARLPGAVTREYRVESVALVSRDDEGEVTLSSLTLLDQGSLEILIELIDAFRDRVHAAVPSGHCERDHLFTLIRELESTCARYGKIIAELKIQNGRLIGELDAFRSIPQPIRLDPHTPIPAEVMARIRENFGMGGAGHA